MDLGEHWRWMTSLILFLLVSIVLADHLLTRSSTLLKEGLTWPKTEATITRSKLSETFRYHQPGPTRTSTSSNSASI